MCRMIRYDLEIYAFGHTRHFTNTSLHPQMDTKQTSRRAQQAHNTQNQCRNIKSIIHASSCAKDQPHTQTCSGRKLSSAFSFQPATRRITRVQPNDGVAPTDTDVREVCGRASSRAWYEPAVAAALLQTRDVRLIATISFDITNWIRELLLVKAMPGTVNRRANSP